MKKNVAGQIVGAQVTATNGTEYSGAVRVYYTLDGVPPQTLGSVGSGVCTHQGRGYHTYAPTQAETNGTLVSYNFSGTGAITTSVHIYTSFPQTVDNDVLASGATGFAAIDTVVDTINSNIGTAGANLTDLGGMSTAMKAEVEVEANDALVANDLDHLVKVAESSNVATNSVIAKLAAKGAGAVWSTYNNITDSLTAQKDLQVATAAHLTDIKGAGWTIEDLGLIVGNQNTAQTDLTQIVADTTDALTRLPTTAELAYIIANAKTGKPVTFTTSGGSTTAAVLALVDGAAASTVDDFYNGHLLVFNLGTLDNVVTDITDYVGSTKTATITAIPYAPTDSHTARLL